jgi:hypothetical protein
VTILAAILATAALSSTATGSSQYFTPGNLVVSRSIYDDNPANVSVGETLPPGCTSGCGAATNDGSYPEVFNNDIADGSFGVTSKIFLDQLSTSGALINTLEVPNSSQNGVPPEKDQLVTSFSSKSELALNLSTDDQQISFMGYLAPIDALDISNSNTPAVFDSTNPDPLSNYRVVASVDGHGKFRFTKTNAYSGNNGRAAILNAAAGVYYLAGNAGNGGSMQPDGVITGGGAQIADAQTKALIAQDPGDPTPVGSFNITQLPANMTSDKIGKDTNFRGLTIFDNVVYFTKGSGGNGIDTVYFIDTSGTACPHGVGVPAAGAALPTSPTTYDPGLLQSKGVFPYNMCILAGFPTKLAKKTTSFFPFGLFFANANTLYVADEGDGNLGGVTGGLEKWTFNGSTWSQAYTLQNGLNLGATYTVPGYPAGNNPATGKPWAPATDGLRNITGRVSGNTATIYGITSTVSGSGDQGADPNKLVAVTDTLSATSPGTETFSTIDAAGSGEVLRGVSFTPGS